ncbi:MAG: chorismate mutase [Clostridia bacterium]|nr:chorismate mutase [Clostridia bacterium]
MRSLEESRAVIDAVDREIVRLFEKRMTIARDVAAYKIGNGMPVLDRSREAQVLESRAAMLDDPYWAESVRTLYEAVMAISRAEQEKLLKAATVAGEGQL